MRGCLKKSMREYFNKRCETNNNKALNSNGYMQNENEQLALGYLPPFVRLINSSSNAKSMSNA